MNIILFIYYIEAIMSDVVVQASTSPILSLTNITAPNYGGTFNCIVLNDAGFGISDSTVYVLPEITVHPVNQYVKINTTVELMCKAEGYPSVSYQWQKDGVDIPGQTMSTIRFNEIGTSDIGMYRCIASNTIGDQTYNVTSNEALIAISPAGTMSISPQNTEVNYGDQVTFRCQVDGGPNNKFKWYINGTTITNSSNWYIKDGAEYSELTISNISTVEHGGEYKCYAENDAGNEAISTFLYISLRFLTLPDSIILTSNGSIETLTCIADSFPVPRYKWVKHAYHQIDADVGEDYLLEFYPIKFGDEGMYRCIVTSNGKSLDTNYTTVHGKYQFV